MYIGSRMRWSLYRLLASVTSLVLTLSSTSVMAGPDPRAVASYQRLASSTIAPNGQESTGHAEGHDEQQAALVVPLDLPSDLSLAKSVPIAPAELSEFTAMEMPQ